MYVVPENKHNYGGSTNPVHTVCNARQCQPGADEEGNVMSKERIRKVPAYARCLTKQQAEA